MVGRKQFRIKKLTVYKGKLKESSSYTTHHLFGNLNTFFKNKN